MRSWEKNSILRRAHFKKDKSFEKNSLKIFVVNVFSFVFVLHAFPKQVNSFPTKNAEYKEEYTLCTTVT